MGSKPSSDRLLNRPQPAVFINGSQRGQFHEDGIVGNLALKMRDRYRISSFKECEWIYWYGL